MPKPPKIPKDLILETALHILIRDGFSGINIKAIAKELNCSTQPISWHFGSMEQLRLELGQYAFAYVDKKTSPTAEHGLDAFSQVGASLTDLAFDEPKLYRFLFIDGGAGYCIGGIEALTGLTDNCELIHLISTENNISIATAEQYVESMIIYTVGILSLCVSGVLKCDRKTVLSKLNKAGDTFLSRSGYESIHNAACAERSL